MTAQVALDRRRARARRLRDEGLSMRDIAARLKVSSSTVHADLRRDAVEIAPVPNIQDADGRPVAGAGPGNTRSLQHGAKSERRIAPLREKHVAALRRSYPRLDDRRLALLADRLARIEAVTAWLDRQGGVLRDEEGEPFPIVRELERWISRAEQALAEVDAEHKQARCYEGLDGYLEEEGGDDGDDS